MRLAFLFIYVSSLFLFVVCVSSFRLFESARCGLLVKKRVVSRCCFGIVFGRRRQGKQASNDNQVYTFFNVIFIDNNSSACTIQYGSPELSANFLPHFALRLFQAGSVCRSVGTWLPVVYRVVFFFRIFLFFLPCLLCCCY